VRTQFVLGTAQLGLAYGIANVHGLPSDAQAAALIEAALAAGVHDFDTARGYGLAERRLGRALTTHPSAIVVTKLDPLDDLVGTVSTHEVERAVDASIYQSCYDLRRGPLDVVLLHRWAHHDAHDGAIWRRLLALRERGAIARLGASVSTPQEARAALADPDVVHLQIPLNALDRRWEDVGAAAHERGVVVHVRSSFLQGLLLTDGTRWPAIPGIASDALVARLSELAQRLGREGRDDLALAYVRAKAWVDGVVVGVDSAEQLARDLALFDRAPLDADGVAAIEASFPDLPSSLLDPARWPVH
jgi:spore coat polysaccharide biosynthesis protein SpsF